MKNIKNRMIFVSGIITLLLLCSCDSHEKKNNEKNYGGTSCSQIQTSIQNKQTTNIPQTSFSKKNIEISEDDRKYIFYKDVVSADEVFECNYYKMPDKINNFDYQIIQINDEESVWVCLSYRSEDKEVSEQGIYNFKTGIYTKVLELITDKTWVLGYGDDYLITFQNTPDLGSICYYDIAENKTSQIFTFNNEIRYGYSDVVILNNKVYYTACGGSDDNIKKWVYSYDIYTNKLEICKENAHSPMCDGNTVYAVCEYGDDEDNRYDVIESIFPDNDFSFNLKMKAGRTACSGGSVFIEVPGSRTKGSTISNKVTQTDILEDPPKDEGSFGNLKCDSGYLYWGNSGGSGNNPCLYDIVNDKIVEFGKMYSKSYSVNMKDGAGLIFSHSQSDDICIFKY